jgi:hypothetical protein
VTDADPRDKAVCQSELSGSRIGSLVAETIVLVNPQRSAHMRPQVRDARWVRFATLLPLRVTRCRHQLQRVLVK